MISGEQLKIYANAISKIAFSVFSHSQKHDEL